MNIDKIKEFVHLADELREEGVFGFSFHSNAVHVNKKELIHFENLQIENSDGSEYPYEIFIEVDGYKIFALAKFEDIKDLPGLADHKEKLKAELLNQIAKLEQEEEVGA
ncbi:hypothetical protein J7E63_13080 [Bacillus sp. ISL-75]|uniref:hypothetical protein n=1 Tax=Bacillus sp. ISL-75 TaxID=2819137 RepID=UPI001BEBF329|nr:hypothetical protein [Bacillus sp. ISL-75]MBT2727873.1 hypothetical protein [Bacillus sp. ISL-75]